MENLEQKIARFPGALAMLRTSTLGGFSPPIPSEYTNWRDEQRSWSTTAVMFDMSHHMTDLTVRGPDTKALLSDVCVNSFVNFGPGRAKQIVACNSDGFVIGDSILIANSENEAVVVGVPTLANWITFQVERGEYDVELGRNEATPFNPGGRNTFRFQLQGPCALDVVHAATGGRAEDVAFFHTAEFEIDGVPVRGLSHTMSRTKGMEIFGDMAGSERVRDALLKAGEPVGLQQGGAVALPTTVLESGWIGVHLPAIYSGDAMRSYREWLPAATYEAVGSLGGSFRSESIVDYYSTPWDLGYSKIVRFDHDFIGRSALETKAVEPKRRRVWLEWNRADVMAVLEDTYFGSPPSAKFLSAPYAVYCTFPFDSVEADGNHVGVSVFTGYTVNLGGWYSLAILDESIQDGSTVTVIWGDPDSELVTVEPNKAVPVRAVVHAQAPVQG
jgi:vanillate/3-O-methylgallate O-demethylase